MSEPRARKFKVPLNRCEITPKMRNVQYTAEQEFEQLRRVRDTITYRLEKQQDLISKIKRGKFRVSLGEVPLEMVLALAKSDLKILENTRANFEIRRVELRHKIHEEAINGSRFDPDDIDEN